MIEIETKAKEIEQLCAALHKQVGKASLYQDARDTVRKVEKLAGDIRREAHNPFAAGGGM